SVYAMVVTVLSVVSAFAVVVLCTTREPTGNLAQSLYAGFSCCSPPGIGGGASSDPTGSGGALTLPHPNETIRPTAQTSPGSVRMIEPGSPWGEGRERNRGTVEPVPAGAASFLLGPLGVRGVLLFVHLAVLFLDLGLFLVRERRGVRCGRGTAPANCHEQN